MNKDKNILIAGGAGFIGVNLALKLINLGYKVTVLDNLSPQIHGENSTLYNSIKGKVKFIKGDVRNKEDWFDVLSNQHIIILHLAAETGTGQPMYEVRKYVDVNVNGTSILLDYLVNEEHAVSKVIIASSRAIYGEGKYKCSTHGYVYPKERIEENLIKGDYEPKCPTCNGDVEIFATDEDSKIHPSSVYGITKQNQEQMVLNVCKSINIPAIAYRYQNVYGPGQSLKNPYTGILSIFSTQIRNGNDINIFEDGNESRDFVYIEDVVEATVLGIKNTNVKYGIFNVGSGVQTTVKQVAEILKKKYKSNVGINIAGDFRHNFADLTKIEKHLGFISKISFEEGVGKFVNWVLSQKVGKDNYSKSIEEMKVKSCLKVLKIN